MPVSNLNLNQQVTFPIPISVILGGTGASDAATARSNLGAVGLMGNETVGGNKEFTGRIKFLDATPATNTTTGTTFAGGIGVAGAVFANSLNIPLSGMPPGNAWGQELVHGATQTYAWNTTPFGAFFAFNFTGAQSIPNQQYYGCKWALGNNANLLGYYCQLLVSRQGFGIYMQWVENGVIVREKQLTTTTLY